MKRLLLIAVTVTLLAGCGHTQFALGKQEVIAFDPAEVTGVWRDDLGAYIAVITMVGDELRAVVAEGHTNRYTMDYKYKQVEDPSAVADAVTSLNSWKETGASIPARSTVYVLAGQINKANNTSNSTGSWARGKDCSGESAKALGNYYMDLRSDSIQGKVLLIRPYSVIKKLEGGMDGDAMDYNRMIFLTKRPTKIKPSLLEKMQKEDNFCRKVAGEKKQ